ncbi:hypothetical protein [Polaromonas eurypsychrophila]|uniref:Uncharacterized protein n=1 Tax=Polaromonas eurypsychrophila TaxID=1614635 RepID=A0A916SQX2_9BURK|nr:hypothetical protein [Polaromonas eurypsychrophila]GGB09159.1 hypothetical protein GCM10011496_32620 [Polaromonas eurypsychrophila]
MTAVATSSALERIAASPYGAHTGLWEAAVVNPCRYWPCELLSAFILQMATQGCCINESMMLGSRFYAMEKLTHAHALDDALLRELAVRMFSYFDNEPVHAVFVLVGRPWAH